MSYAGLGCLSSECTPTGDMRRYARFFSYATVALPDLLPTYAPMLKMFVQDAAVNQYHAPLSGGGQGDGVPGDDLCEADTYQTP